jgi:hypothetical protein
MLTNNLIVVFINKKDFSRFDHLITLMNNLGWFPSNYMNDGTKFSQYAFDVYSKNKKQIQILFAAKFDIEEDQIPDEMYHLTLTRKIDKIKKYGLTPKTNEKNASHPERIYLLKYEEHAYQLASQFAGIEGHDEDDYTLLTINTSLLKKETTFRLFRDPMFTDEDTGICSGYYTLNNIPPFLIS